MKVVVQKFGGTCVESEANQLITAERIMEARDRNLHPVVVVSAMGREGQPYSTVELVSAARSIHPDIEPRELDLIMSCGEIISTAAMAHLLKTKGYDTIALTGGQAGLMTDEFFGHARIIRIEPRQLLAALQEGLMVFVAGFQGNTNDHQITTLGAGGSDYTAVALTHVINDTPQLPFGEKLEIEPLQIFKEVDGIMTANPKSLEEGSAPRALPQLTYDECVVMSRLGAEVIQHQAAEMARKYRIPLAVHNFLVADGGGTQVSAETKCADESRPTAIVDQPGLLVFDIGSENPRLLLQIAERLDRERLTFFQVAAKRKTRFAVRPLKYRRVEAIVRQVLLSRGLNAEISAGDFALVSVVGEALRGRLDHWEEKAERVLADSKTEVHGGGRDDISLSLLVPGDRRKRAVTELHKALVL